MALSGCQTFSSEGYDLHLALLVWKIIVVVPKISWYWLSRLLPPLTPPKTPSGIGIFNLLNSSNS